VLDHRITAHDPNGLGCFQNTVSSLCGPTSGNLAATPNQPINTVANCEAGKAGTNKWRRSCHDVLALLTGILTRNRYRRLNKRHSRGKSYCE